MTRTNAGRSVAPSRRNGSVRIQCTFTAWTRIHAARSWSITIVGLRVTSSVSVAVFGSHVKPFTPRIAPSEYSTKSAAVASAA
jgi:hypothetical protein